MSYPAAFHRLVMIYDAYGDTCNTTLSIVPGLSGTMPAVTDALLSSVATVVGNWWPTQAGSSPPGPGISFDAALKSIKLNRISTAGLYADPETKEHVYPTPINGGPGTRVPPQLSVVVTLRGQNQRAKAGKGRVYMPITAGTITGLGTDGRLSSSAALVIGNGYGNLLAALADVYLGASINAVPGIASRAGAGAFQAVDTMTVGRVIDTMRSRRNKIAEAPEDVTSYP